MQKDDIPDCITRIMLEEMIYLEWLVFTDTSLSEYVFKGYNNNGPRYGYL